MGIADTIFARLQSTTGSIYHPVGFDSRKQSVKRVPSPGTSQDAVSIHPMHFGSHYHIMLFYSSGLAVTPDERPLSNPGNLKLFIARLLLLSQPHTTELRVQFIWQGYSSNSHHPWAGAQLNSLCTTQDCCLAAGIKTSQSSAFYM